MMTREQYLTPNPNVPPPWVLPRRWTPPSEKDTRGARSIGFSSKGSSRTVFVVDGHVEGVESDLELSSGLWLLAQPDIVDVISQWPQVQYVDRDGVLRRFTFDFTSVHSDRSRTAHSIKPEDKVASSEVEEIHRLLQRQMSPKLASRINLVTEAKLKPQDRFNAEVIYTARRFPVPEHDAAIEKLIGDLHGTTTVGALRQASGLHGAGFRAIVRLIAARKLELVEHVRIVSQAVVRRPKGS
ncbi:hypothetical protein [Bradyrhizobium sp. BR 10289]|uniref:hypothetical protein n=1 Tax=Bradyrhizobium sp. BR 10289 TaxID=2749993 RepID=UPI001C64581C|nr:hypothetical protein [Bradyrhizobium sp. BR 10289]MBW7974597.1 hypothetical protein [Bradyrhizobium sp. BR 10289]